MTSKSPLPPRRLLAVAAALALFGGPAAAGTAPAPAEPGTAGASSCPLGAFRCPPRPANFAMCRPNALLEFYDPALSRDSSQRDTANTKVDAVHVDSSDQSIYKLNGNVRIERADQLLRADRVDYNDQTTDYDAQGNVRYQEAGQLLSADRMRGNTDASHGIADNVRYQMLEARGNGVARRGEMLDAQRSHYTQVTYSTCDVGHHLWEVRAKDLKTDKTTGVGTARSATMRFANVPFLYLPYFTFPIDDRRKSGFLFPTIGSSNRSGMMLGVPYYLNLAPNYDATLEPRLYTQRGTLLAGEFRYLFPGTRGQLNLEYLPNDRGNSDDTVESTKGRDRWLLKYTDSTALAPGWSFGTNINRTSDRNYLRDFGNDLYTSAIGTLASNAYVYGSGNWWSASFGVDSYQNVDPYLPDTVVQYKRWPRATFNMDVPLAHWLEFGLDSEAVAFRKDDVIEGKRADLSPYLAADFRGAAWFVKPKLAYRYTAYQLDPNYQRFDYRSVLATGATSPFDRRSPSRSLPIASIDSGLIFDRSTSLFGSQYTQTLEPRLYYLYVPYRNQNNLPLFDTSLMSFDYWQLFSPNQFSGADRQMNANNLTAALTTRLLDDSGVERLSASFGQIRYFTPQKVQLPNCWNGKQSVACPATDWSGSDYVAQLGVQLSDRWRLNSSYQWSPNTRQTDLGAVELQRRIGADGILNFSYRYRRTPGAELPLLEQYDASVVYPVSERWRLLGRWTYSVKDKRTVEALAGVEYDSCCVAVRVVGRHYVRSFNGNTNQVGTNNAVMLELEFKGLGSLNGQTEDLLRRGILGYQ
ncbi:organic solvent tolerance protein [Frateuria sp. Soil773]|uniref:LPS-assembly protein LptD n=1 Tax=Frateuria sp. Soil773 TaxID=1736407 RepID=UPI0007008CDF|nr:LPS assembly protein LptD [Frateuria sp. Soil773]KRE88773.1 organic solvent tolerance protein [Frateuria sp. Soil773]